MNKIVIIGCGFVGATYAYALLNDGKFVNEIVLMDVDNDKAIGEALDLSHCITYCDTNIKIKVGNYSDFKDADIVCITAGKNQVFGETRMDALEQNSNIMKNIVDNVIASNFSGIFLIASNPLDVMTYITWKESGFSSDRVIGSGTSLDSARLRYYISEHLGVSPKNIHGYVLGEHGDSQFIPWSSIKVLGDSIYNFLTQQDLDKIAEETRNAGYSIIEKKKATYYGIGKSLARITNAILGNENALIPVSVYDKDNDVYISLPAIININGISQIKKLKLTPEEQEKYMNSVNILKNAINKIM